MRQWLVELRKRYASGKSTEPRTASTTGYDSNFTTRLGRSRSDANTRIQDGYRLEDGEITGWYSKVKFSVVITVIRYWTKNLKRSRWRWYSK